LPVFEECFFWIAIFLQQFPANSQNIKGFFKLSYLVYSQIWLNFLVDDHQIGYITNWKKNLTCILFFWWLFSLF
jgi:hypothetical protein